MSEELGQRPGNQREGLTLKSIKSGKFETNLKIGGELLILGANF